MPGGGNFENWFEFALTKKAEIIHLTGVVILDYEGLFLRLPNKNNGFECLKNLYLSHSKMTDRDFELLISNCLVLECLAIVLSIKLKNVSIVGHSKLKHLNLSFLWGIRSIMIRDAINLLSLTCCEWRIGCSVQLSNIPKLSKLDVRDDIRNKVTHVQLLDGMPSCICDQLQLLRLSSKAVSMYEVMNHLFFVLYTPVSVRHMLNLEVLKNSSLQLVNIKHLELVLDMTNDSNWYYFPRYACRLVEACRSLQKLVIKFLHTRTLILTEFKAETYGHPGCDLSQKYLEISGYSGSSSERELALYVINNATALQKLTVVACDEEALSRARLDFQHINSVSFFSY
ncbi:hypothetical protein SASPL_134591 [Salvia splendens]|uniref:FBD domain-containing protein n=1 Tax=Salvia splendens TaxID=180675 RepID=A0A8X8WWA4_SALSN|nr:hypothetical protein SASPL_134591 [Salvia splendens]